VASKAIPLTSKPEVQPSRPVELLPEQRESADDEHDAGARNHRDGQHAPAGDQGHAGHDAEASEHLLGHAAGGL
jgi:hypothetical protein